MPKYVALKFFGYSIVKLIWPPVGITAMAKKLFDFSYLSNCCFPIGIGVVNFLFVEKRLSKGRAIPSIFPLADTFPL